MNPSELNVVITAAVNYFYSVLTKEDFTYLTAVLNELSKAMIATNIFRDQYDKRLAAAKKAERN